MFPSGKEDSNEIGTDERGLDRSGRFHRRPSLTRALQDNSEKQLTCANAGYGGERARHCEMREQTLPSIGHLTVDAGQNGGATVKGWLRSDVLVRARVEASGDTEASAANMASRVMIDASGGQVRAIGPEPANNSWWSVSYEIFVPQHERDESQVSHRAPIRIRRGGGSECRRPGRVPPHFRDEDAVACDDRKLLPSVYG
jgi:hypothetical protein